MGETNRKYRIDTEENRAFMKDLTEDLLRFGHRFPSPGGSSYYLGDDGTPWTDRARQTFVTARMAHSYTIGAFLGHEGSAELIDAALKGLNGELKDREHGGWYPGIEADGSFQPDKQCYAHAFVILAASSALIAGRPGAKELLGEAIAAYDRFFWDEEEGMAYDTWNTEFTVLDDYRGLNANMHTVEAFLAAADCAGLEEYRVRAGRIIDRVISWASANNWRIPEHFSKDWEPDLECNKDRPADQFKPYGATPGHGLEWGRLITQWAVSYFADRSAASADVEAAGEKDGWKPAGDRSYYIDAAESLFLRAVQDAWSADGAPGFVYTTDWNGDPVVHDRMHWVLAEAINTAATLYRVTGKSEYADYYAEFVEYLDEKVVDYENGSWFHQMDRENHVIGTVWPGKNDLYHALQATLIPYYRPGISIALAVKEDAR